MKYSSALVSTGVIISLLVATTFSTIWPLSNTDWYHPIHILDLMGWLRRHRWINLFGTGAAFSNGQQKQRKLLQKTLIDLLIPVQIPFYMNCGRLVGTFTDNESGIVWQPDKFYTKGSTSSNVCTQAKLFGFKGISPKDCWVRSGANLSYAIPVPNRRRYKVTIHFMEIEHKISNKRIFNVTAEGKTVISKLDLVAVFKDIYTPGTRSFLVKVIDGVLNIMVQTIQDKGVFSAVVIEDYTVSSIENATTLHINAGSMTNYKDPLTGRTWLADQYFNSIGKLYSACPRKIESTLLDGIYCSERYYPGLPGTTGKYTLPITPGKYQVKLMFAELYYNAPSKRIFDVYVQNQLLKRNLDIYVASGNRSNNAYILSTNIFIVKNGTSDAANLLMITFVNVKDYAKISAIEIVPFPVVTVPTVSSRPSTKLPYIRPILYPQPNPPAFDNSQQVNPTIVPAELSIPAAVMEYRINCGYHEPFVDSVGRKWLPDMFNNGGQSYSKIVPVDKTVDDALYQYERIGDAFSYAIPLPAGSYEITLHFAEHKFTLRKERLFDILVETAIRRNVDLLALSGGPNTASKLTFFALVDDGILNIEFSKAVIPLSIPKVNAIEVFLDAQHISHAVATGPYTATVVDKTSNKAKVSLTGQTSHTHGEDLNLKSFVWKEGNTLLGSTVNVDHNFTAGNHTISLTVKDDGGFQDIEVTTVSVRPFGYPAILRLEPHSGAFHGNEDMIIQGSGFNYTAFLTKVTFGTKTLTGSKLVIVNSSTIKVKTPPSSIAQSVSVSVATPLGTSDAVEFDYIGVPIVWTSGKVLETDVPTVGRFGPDEKLYVGTRKGRILKIAMNANFTQSVTTVSVLVNSNEESIMGLAFDPMDTKVNPDVYFTSNTFSHKGKLSSSDPTTNGKIRRASGPALDNVIDIVTGLPVSDLDHGLNSIEFGDEGELYFSSGSHTNGGLPGKLSSSRVLKENFLSAAVNVAYLSHPDFDGDIQWTSPDDGNMIAIGIDNFSTGLRNPYGIVLHTNGYLYGTDNGSNEGYGTMSTGCGENDFIPDQKRDDEVILLQQGQYYGSPNRKRAEYFKKAFQCIWFPPEANSTSFYTAPLLTHASSIDGIMEFHGNHFDRQLRYNLIFIRFNSMENIFRVVLTPDGKSVASSLNRKALKMNIGSTGLDITQAPNGNLIEIGYTNEAIFYHQPIEAATEEMIVKTVFPRRGRSSGGNMLHIYGVNFMTNAFSPTVTVGGVVCPILEVSETKIDCKLPGGLGTVDILVTNGASTSLFERGYRYVSGLPRPSFVIPVYN